MVIGKFKTNHPFMFALLLFIAIALWIDGFIFYDAIKIPKENNAPFYRLVVHFFDQQRFISVLSSFLFMILQAFMFNRVVAGKNLVDRNSYLPALIYIVLMSSSFNLFGMHPVWFVNFFLIIAIDKIFDVFSEKDVFLEIFNVGFFISLASLFYLPALLFIILLIASLLIYYLINVRALAASLIGLTLPYIFVSLYYFWFDRLHQEFIHFYNTLLGFEIVFLPLVPYGWASVAVIGFLGLVSLFKTYLGTVGDKPVRIRKRYYILLVYLLVSLLSFTLAGSQWPVNQGVVMMPLSAIIAGFFQENKRALINELFFSLLIMLLLLGKIARLD